MNTQIDTDGRTAGAIYDELNDRLEAEYLIDEYFSPSWRGRVMGRTKTELWPKSYCWIACYAVTGGSEGHYIHVDVILDRGELRHYFLGKTFRGMAHAQKIAARCAELLGA